VSRQNEDSTVVVIFTREEAQQLWANSSEQRRIVAGFSPQVRDKYLAMQYFEAINKIKQALGGTCETCGRSPNVPHDCKEMYV